MAARAAAGINLYEISPRTLGGISSLEIASDPFRDQEPMVIYFSDGDPARDEVPAHLPQGYPLFQPHAIHESERAMHAHYQEFIKNANHMRKYLMSFAREMDTLTVNFSDQIHEGDVVITPERLHAPARGRVIPGGRAGCLAPAHYVTFTGGGSPATRRATPCSSFPSIRQRFRCWPCSISMWMKATRCGGRSRN
jgi:hypothetical protein